jgi:hypothetical protein
VGNYGGSSEDQNDDRNENSKDCAHEVSSGNEDSIRDLQRICLHFVPVLRLRV